MSHKCYILFKTEDNEYKSYIQDSLNVEMIDKSLNEAINSDNFDYIMRVIREQYLSDSTVTIFLIGSCSSENLGGSEQRYIKRELQASLYNSSGNTRNGILGVVLPEMTDKVFRGEYICDECGKKHNNVAVNDNTVIKEFSYNYYLPTGKCAWGEEDRYCILAKWEDFKADPEKYTNRAYDKRTSDIAGKVKVRP